MKLSYGILAHDEHVELERLLKFLTENIDEEDEIVVVLDPPEDGSEKIENVCKKYDKLKQFSYYIHFFKNNFADQKNYLNSFLNGEWVVNLDCDEIPNIFLIQNIKTIIESNTAEAYWVPRINTVEGITDEHLRKWGWKINDKGWVNFPDQQLRIYKRSSIIYWKGKVHEKITGYKEYGILPHEEEYCIYHPKTILKQEQQNKLYETI